MKINEELWMSRNGWFYPNTGGCISELKCKPPVGCGTVGMTHFMFINVAHEMCPAMPNCCNPERSREKTATTIDIKSTFWYKMQIIHATANVHAQTLLTEFLKLC